MSNVPPHVDCHREWCGLALRVNTEHGANFRSTSPAPTTPPHHPPMHIQQLDTCHSFRLLTQLLLLLLSVFKRQPSVYAERSNPPFQWGGLWGGGGAWERAWPHLTSFTPSPVEDGPSSAPGSWHMMGHVQTAVETVEQRSQS